MVPLLVVTPFFAPQSHAAVFRAYKVVKLLPSLGYRPFVVTVDTNYDYHEDESLSLALPPEVTVVRACHIEPTPRGLELALGLGDRRFGRARTGTSNPATSAGGPAPRSLKKELRQLVTHGLLRIPDRHWTWYWPALAAARRLIREHDIRVVLTSQDPFTSYLIGLALKADGLKWVADLRDPPTHCRTMHSSYPWVFALQREIERRAMLAADAVTVAAASIALALSEFHGVDLSSKAHFIPTGVDESLLGRGAEQPRSDGERIILFSGEYLPYYGDKFLRAFALALRDPEVARLGYRVVFAGRMDVNRPRLAPLLARHGLEAHASFQEHQPQQGLYELLRKSEFALLPLGALSLWWCLPAKLVDYLALRKPVIAMVPDPSEARTRLTEAGLGIFLDGDDERSTATLVQALKQGGASLRPNEAVCKRYTAQRQVAAFAEIFARLQREAVSTPSRGTPR
jgi:hypothetical protein